MSTRRRARGGVHFILPASAAGGRLRGRRARRRPADLPAARPRPPGTVAQDAPPTTATASTPATSRSAPPGRSSRRAPPSSSPTGGVDARSRRASRTVELWVNPNRLARGQQAGIVSHGDPAGDGWAFGVGAKRKLASSRRRARPSKVTLPSSVWTPADRDVVEPRSASTSTAALAKSVNAPGALPGSSSGAVVVGGNGAGAFTGAFAGRVDEVALYPEELTAATSRPTSTPPTCRSTRRRRRSPALDGRRDADGHAGHLDRRGVATPAYQWQRCDADGDDCEDIAARRRRRTCSPRRDACMHAPGRRDAHERLRLGHGDVRGDRGRAGTCRARIPTRTRSRRRSTRRRPRSRARRRSARR